MFGVCRGVHLEAHIASSYGLEGKAVAFLWPVEILVASKEY